MRRMQAVHTSESPKTDNSNRPNILIGWYPVGPCVLNISDSGSPGKQLLFGLAPNNSSGVSDPNSVFGGR